MPVKYQLTEIFLILADVKFSRYIEVYHREHDPPDHSLFDDQIDQTDSNFNSSDTGRWCVAGVNLAICDTHTRTHTPSPSQEGRGRDFMTITLLSAHFVQWRPSRRDSFGMFLTVIRTLRNIVNGAITRKTKG